MSARFFLSCKCGRSTAVATTQAGQTARCACGEKLEVPTLQKLRRLPRVPDDAPKATGGGPAWGLHQRLAMIGLLVAALGLGFFVYHWFERPRPNPLDDVNLRQSMYLWSYYSRGINYLTDGERTYFVARELNRKWLVASGALAAVGGILIVTGLLVRPRPAAKSKPGAAARP